MNDECVTEQTDASNDLGKLLIELDTKIMRRAYHQIAGFNILISLQMLILFIITVNSLDTFGIIRSGIVLGCAALLFAYLGRWWFIAAPRKTFQMHESGYVEIDGNADENEGNLTVYKVQNYSIKETGIWANCSDGEDRCIVETEGTREKSFNDAIAALDAALDESRFVQPKERMFRYRDEPDANGEFPICFSISNRKRKYPALFWEMVMFGTALFLTAFVLLAILVGIAGIGTENLTGELLSLMLVEMLCIIEFLMYHRAHQTTPWDRPHVYNIFPDRMIVWVFSVPWGTLIPFSSIRKIIFTDKWHWRSMEIEYTDENGEARNRVLHAPALCRCKEWQQLFNEIGKRIPENAEVIVK